MGQAQPQMSLYTRICVALAGICGGIVVMFAVDMLFNSGRFVAHTLHAKTPDCSGSCHGPTEQISAPRSSAGMVLPHLQAADRSRATATGAGCNPLLGVPVAVEGGD